MSFDRVLTEFWKYISIVFKFCNILIKNIICEKIIQIFESLPTHLCVIPKLLAYLRDIPWQKVAVHLEISQTYNYNNALFTLKPLKRTWKSIKTSLLQKFNYIRINYNF
jgi:hypothetical protein